MRTSQDQYVAGVNHGKRLLNGYDYENQAWVIDGKYVNCGHPEGTCRCFGRLHKGEETQPRSNN